MFYISSIHHFVSRRKPSIDSICIQDSKLSTLKLKYIIQEPKQSIICSFNMLLHKQAMKNHCLADIIEEFTQLFIIKPTHINLTILVQYIFHWAQIFAILNPIFSVSTPLYLLSMLVEVCLAVLYALKRDYFGFDKLGAIKINLFFNNSMVGVYSFLVDGDNFGGY